MKAPKGYTIVSRKFLQGYRQLGITFEEAMLIIHLMDYTFSNSTPFPKIATIANHTGKSDKTIRRQIRSLRAKGYLRTRVRYGRSNAYDFSALLEILEDPMTNWDTQTPPNCHTQTPPNVPRQTPPNCHRRKKKKKEETPENNKKLNKKISPRILQADYEKLLEQVSTNLANHGIRWKATPNRIKQLQAFMKTKKATFDELSSVLLWFSSSSHSNAEWLRHGGQKRNGRPYKLETLLRPSKFPGYLEMAEDEEATAIATPDRRTFTPEQEAERLREIAELEAQEALDER